jgi:hypothetical protein
VTDYNHNTLDTPRDWTDAAAEYVSSLGQRDDVYDVTVRFLVFAADPKEASSVAFDVGTALSRVYTSRQFPQNLVPVTYPPSDIPTGVQDFAGRVIHQSRVTPTTLRLTMPELTGLVHLPEPKRGATVSFATPAGDLPEQKARYLPEPDGPGTRAAKDTQPIVQPAQTRQTEIAGKIGDDVPLGVRSQPRNYDVTQITRGTPDTDTTGDVGLQHVTNFDYDEAAAVRNYGIRFQSDVIESTVKTVRDGTDTAEIETAITTDERGTVIGRNAYSEFFARRQESVCPGLVTDTSPAEPAQLDIETLTEHGLLYGSDDDQVTTVQSHLIEQFAHAGHGCVCLDPDGDLVASLLKRLPEHRLEDVVYIDPVDQAHGLSPQLNPLEQLDVSQSDSVSGDSATGFADDFLSLLTAEYFGVPPIASDVARTTIELMQELPSTYTLADLQAVLADEVARKRLLAAADEAHFAGRQYLSEKFATTDQQELRRIASVIGDLLLGPAGDLFASKNETTFDLTERLDNDQIVLVAPSGSDTLNRLTVAAMLQHVWDAASKRATRDTDTSPALTVVNSAEYALKATASPKDRLRTATDGQVGVLFRPEHPKALTHVTGSILKKSTDHQIILSTDSDEAARQIASDCINVEEETLQNLPESSALLDPSGDGPDTPKQHGTTLHIDLFAQTPVRRTTQEARTFFPESPAHGTENTSKLWADTSPLGVSFDNQRAVLEAVWEAQIRTGGPVTLSEIDSAFEQRTGDRLAALDNCIRVPTGTIESTAEHTPLEVDIETVLDQTEFEEPFCSLTQTDGPIRITDEGKQWLFDRSEYENSDTEGFRRVTRELFAAFAVAGHHPTVSFTTSETDETPGIGLLVDEDTTHVEKLGTNPRFRFLDGQQSSHELAASVIRDYEAGRHTVLVPHQAPARDVDQLVRDAVDALKDPFLAKKKESYAEPSDTRLYNRSDDYTLEKDLDGYLIRYPVIPDSSRTEGFHWTKRNGVLFLCELRNDKIYRGRIERPDEVDKQQEFRYWCGKRKDNGNWEVNSIEDNIEYQTREQLEEDWYIAPVPAIHSLAETPDEIDDPRVEVLHPGPLVTEPGKNTESTPSETTDDVKCDRQSNRVYTSPLTQPAGDSPRSIAVRASKLPLLASPNGYEFLISPSTWSDDKIQNDITRNSCAGNHHIRAITHAQVEAIDAPRQQRTQESSPPDDHPQKYPHPIEPNTDRLENKTHHEYVGAPLVGETWGDSLTAPLHAPRDQDISNYPCDPTQPEYWESLSCNFPIDGWLFPLRSFILSHICTYSNVSMDTAEQILTTGIDAGVLLGYPPQQADTPLYKAHREAYRDRYRPIQRDEAPGRYLTDPYQYNRDYWYRKILKHNIEITQKQTRAEHYEVSRSALRDHVTDQFDTKLAAGKALSVVKRTDNDTPLVLRTPKLAEPYFEALYEHPQVDPEEPLPRAVVVEALYEYYMADRRHEKSKPTIQQQIDTAIEMHSIKRVSPPDGESTDSTEYLRLTTWDEAKTAHNDEHSKKSNTQEKQTTKTRTQTTQNATRDTEPEAVHSETQQQQTEQTADQPEISQTTPEAGHTPTPNPEANPPTKIDDFHDPDIEELEEEEAMQEFLDRFIEFKNPDEPISQCRIITKQFRKLWNKWGTYHGHDSYPAGTLMQHHFDEFIDIDYRSTQINVDSERPRIYEGIRLSQRGQLLAKALFDDDNYLSTVLTKDR